MGSSSSKVARSAASGAARKFPSRTPGAAAAETARSRKPQASPAQDTTPREDHLPSPSPDNTSDNLGAAFTQRLHDMGIMQPNPTFSSSSTASSHLSPEIAAAAPLGPLFPAARHNPTLVVLEAQRALEREAGEDFEAAGRGAPRRFVDVGMLAEAVEWRARGVEDGEVERRLRMRGGLLGRLGPVEVLERVD